MAPTPESPTPEAPSPTGSLKSHPQTTYWTKANIISTTIFIVICVLLLAAALSLFLYRRRQTKKLASQEPDAAALLPPNKDKENMFSRDRASSVTLYLDSEDRTKHANTDTMHLVPLHMTPVQEARDPLAGLGAGPGLAVTTDRAVSVGSSVSGASGRTSQGSVLLSPVVQAEDADAGLRSVGRPRSMSTASTRSRYYERADVRGIPEVPRIVHTAV